MITWNDTVEVSDAQVRLRELLDAIKEGAEITLVEGQEVVARLVPPLNSGVRTPGLHLGALAPAGDFDAPLEDAFWSSAK